MKDADASTQLQIVVIDDDPMMLESIGAALSSITQKTRTFLQPLEAIEWIRKNGADIVVCDICMPRCDGFTVLKKVKEAAPECAVIFITAFGQTDTAVRALREGAADFFLKPFTLEDLQAAIERTSRFRILAKRQAIMQENTHALHNERKNHHGNRYLMISRNPVMQQMARDIVSIAETNATVLILGESGVGKELIAHALHDSSPRRNRPLLTVNCPSIPEELFESEIFGHRRGAYTGATETREGYVGAAEGGTLFLDEIGDLPLRSQAKILRLLEQRVYAPVGEHLEREADVRIIAATNQHLETAVEQKHFRADLFYRLSVCTIRVPALRERPEDIPLLAEFFAVHFSEETGRHIEGLEQSAIDLLTAHSFPGNVRELRNIIESAVIHARHPGKLTAQDLPALKSPPLNPPPQKENASAAGSVFGSLRLDEVEEQLIDQALQQTDGNVSAAARLLGVSRGKLRRRLEMRSILHKTPEKSTP